MVTGTVDGSDPEAAERFKVIRVTPNKSLKSNEIYLEKMNFDQDMTS